jgi:hypothetical protein
MKIGLNHWLQPGGALITPQGLVDFVDQGVWSADDRILAFCTQASGGLVDLIFHGKQPQSANAFLLRQPTGALRLSLILEAGSHPEIIQHRFQSVTIMPYGWENHFRHKGLNIHSSLCAQGSSLVWQVQVSNMGSEAVAVTPTLTLESDALSLEVNGRRTWNGPETWQGSLRLTAHDQLQTRTWINTPGFKDFFIDAKTILLLSTSDPLPRIEGLSLNLASEKIPPGGQGRVNYFFIICGSSEEQVARELDRLRAAPEHCGQEQSIRYAARAKAHPTIQVDGFPFAAAVFDLAPLYAEAASVTGTGALRSSSGGYYFVWGWDALMGGHELTRWGDPQAARQLLDFMATHRAPDGSIPHRFDNDLQPLQVTGYGFTSLLFISLLYQYYSETLDIETLTRFYPVARQIFETLASNADERGFYHSLGMYPDAPLKLGRTPQSYVSYEIGFWYCACRMMEILAFLQGEVATTQIAARLAEHLESSYLYAFYDPSRGFLIDCIAGPAGESNGTYPRYALFPLHNAFGARLFRPVIPDISQFIEHELFKPDGIRMVPDWDPHTGTETVTGDCWFLHFDLYCLKAFRRAGDGAAIERWLRLAEAYFSKRCSIPELQMMDSSAVFPPDWHGAVGQIWQLFVMSGWTRGLLEGVLGLETDIGGLTYIPCPSSLPIRLGKYPFRGGTWKVDVSGEGSWVVRLTVDGKILEGSMKVPIEFYTLGDHHLEILRTALPPAAPCLLEATGAAVIESTLEERRLVIRLQAFNHVNLVFYTPFLPQVLMNGDPFQVDWNPESGITASDIVLQGIQELVVEKKPSPNQL